MVDVSVPLWGGEVLHLVPDWTCSSCHPMVDITGSTKRPFGPSLQEFAVDAVDGPHLGVAQEIEYRPRTWGIFGHEPAEKK